MCTRAAHYIRQAALGIQHAHEAAGLVHRDIKPGNILVDRNGIVKVLDMGLARFFNDTDDILTKKYDENVLGTADYLAPEQALDSHGVDIRADIYSLGATFYFCLTGRPPFAEGSIAQKLIWHQTRQPKPVRSIRPDVPPEIAAIIEKAMSKDPAQRYQTPMAVAEALAPWAATPIPPPPESEMPRLSAAAMGAGSPGGDSTLTGVPRTGASDPPSGAKTVAGGQWIDGFHRTAAAADAASSNRAIGPGGQAASGRVEAERSTDAAGSSPVRAGSACPQDAYPAYPLTGAVAADSRADSAVGRACSGACRTLGRGSGFLGAAGFRHGRPGGPARYHAEIGKASRRGAAGSEWAEPTGSTRFEPALMDCNRRGERGGDLACRPHDLDCDRRLV